MSDQEEWTEVERARLAALDDAAEPPEGLERRVVEALRARGTISLARRAWMGQVAAMAAGVLLFVGGMWAGRTMAVPTADLAADLAPTSPRFALFLYPGPAPRANQDESALVEEYGRWARGLTVRGNFASGEKLMPGAVLLPSEESATAFGGFEPESLEGFFLIDARSEAEAGEIARTCPHLRHGGIVAVREIDPT